MEEEQRKQPPPSPYNKSKSGYSRGNIQKKKKLSFGESKIEEIEISVAQPLTFNSLVYTLVENFMDDKSYNVEDIIDLLEKNKELLVDKNKDNLLLIIGFEIDEKIKGGLITKSQLDKFEALVNYLEKGIKPRKFLKPIKLPTKSVSKK